MGNEVTLKKKSLDKEKYLGNNNQKFINNVSPDYMEKLVDQSVDYTRVDRGNYFWGRGADLLSPDAGPCIVIGMGSPVKKIFHDSSWNELEGDLAEMGDIKPTKVIATGTSIMSPGKKDEVERMMKEREYAKKTLIDKFGEENVDISWSDNNSFTTVFYDHISDEFYKSN
jgi:hypothetical protein